MASLRFPWPNLQDAQEDLALLRLVLDETRQLAVGADADVEVAVRAEDHAVRGLGDEVCSRLLIGQDDARRAVGRAAGTETVDRLPDLVLPRRVDRRQLDARARRIDDDRHSVVFGELLDKHPQPGLHERQFIGAADPSSPTRRPKKTRRSCARTLRGGDFLPLEGRSGPAGDRRVPRAAADIDVNRERRVALRLRIVVGEVVDQLLDPRGVGGRPLALVQDAPDNRIRRRVHVDRERRKLIARCAEERILDDPPEFLGVGVVRHLGFGVKVLGKDFRFLEEFLRSSFALTGLLLLQ